MPTIPNMILGSVIAALAVWKTWTLGWAVFGAFHGILISAKQTNRTNVQP